MSSERQLLDSRDPWWGEHVHRYNEVLPHMGSEDVILDLACGTGFGSDILAQFTNGKVVGGDISEDTVKECLANWQRPNLHFQVLDGTALPFEDNYFNKIVSFETIEHTTQYQKMLEEFYRALKPGGTAFISTPNFPVNSPSGKVLNPYHTQEFTWVELEKILKQVFSQVEIKGQRYSRYDEPSVSKFGKVIDWFFNIIGIRKLPYSIKNGVSNFFTKRSFYPTAADFTMVKTKTEVLKCKTFFCICRK